jgi:hypothetical protein
MMNLSLIQAKDMKFPRGRDRQAYTCCLTRYEQIYLTGVKYLVLDINGDNKNNWTIQITK